MSEPIKPNQVVFRAPAKTRIVSIGAIPMAPFVLERGDEIIATITLTKAGGSVPLQVNIEWIENEPSP
jgi:hypothetical protein